MLLSGPRSYFNDYARKNGLGRALNDPPTLLTDRGAYVNFLEIQLERVSASCLSIQSYDQKFNDVHEMIVGLEQRCGNTTKLVNIAQQCTLELRNENEAKLQAVATNVKGEHYEMQQLMQAMSTRISAAEQVLTTLPSLVARMDTIECRIAKNEVDFELYQKNMAEKSKSDDDEFLSLRDTNAAFKAEADRLKSEVSKNAFEIQENDGRTKRCFTNLEDNFQEELKTDRDETSRKFEVLTSNMNFQVEKLQADSVSRESGCLSALRLYKEANAENMSMLQKDFAQRHDAIETDVESQFSDVNTALQEGLSTLGSKLTMTGNRISVLSTEYTEHKNSTAEVINALETDVDDVYNSIDDMAEDITNINISVDTAKTANTEHASDLVRITEDISILDRILGETDASIESRFHHLNRQLMELSSAFGSGEAGGRGAGGRGMGHRGASGDFSSRGARGPTDEETVSVTSLSNTSESDEEYRYQNQEYPYHGKLPPRPHGQGRARQRNEETPFPPGQRVDSDGRVILDYIGAGLYSGIAPSEAGRQRKAGRDHIHKMVTTPTNTAGDNSLLKRSVSFDPVMRSGSPPAKREKLGYIGSGIYWDRSQHFDKHLVLEMLEEMKDSDSVDPVERAELLYAARHHAHSPPEATRARIRELQREKDMEKSEHEHKHEHRHGGGGEEEHTSRLTRRDSGGTHASARSEHTSHTARSERSNISGNSKAASKQSEAKHVSRSDARSQKNHERPSIPLVPAVPPAIEGTKQQQRRSSMSAVSDSSRPSVPSRTASRVSIESVSELPPTGPGKAVGREEAGPRPALGHRGASDGASVRSEKTMASAASAVSSRAEDRSHSSRAQTKGEHQQSELSNSKNSKPFAAPMPSQDIEVAGVSSVSSSRHDKKKAHVLASSASNLSIASKKSMGAVGAVDDISATGTGTATGTTAADISKANRRSRSVEASRRSSGSLIDPSVSHPRVNGVEAQSSLGSFAVSENSGEVKDGASVGSKGRQSQTGHSVGSSSHRSGGRVREGGVTPSTNSANKHSYNHNYKQSSKLSAKHSSDGSNTSATSSENSRTLTSIQDRVKHALRSQQDPREVASSILQSDSESDSESEGDSDGEGDSDRDSDQEGHGTAAEATDAGTNYAPAYGTDSSDSSDTDGDDKVFESESDDDDGGDIDDDNNDMLTSFAVVDESESGSEEEDGYSSLHQSRSLMDMSAEAIEPSSRARQATRPRSTGRGRSTTKTTAALAKKTTASGRVREFTAVGKSGEFSIGARRSVSPHLTMKPEYFYYDDILANEAKDAITSPHDRVPAVPWVPNSSTVRLAAEA
jgi:hypothetical protein